MPYFKIAFKNSMVYRFSVVFSIIGGVLWVVISMFLWRFLFQGNDEMIAYMTKYVIISEIIAMFYTRNVSYNIAQRVTSGDFAVDLIRPINLFSMSYQKELARLASDFVLTGIPIIIIFLPLLIQGGFHNVSLTLIAVLAGHLLMLLIDSLLGFSSFILIEIWPFHRLIGDTIRLVGGSFIPLSMLPGILQDIAYAMPFRFLYSFPLEMLLGSVDSMQILPNFLTLFIWILFFATANIVVYRLALRNTVVQGG